jgi:hypothetical protein
MNVKRKARRWINIMFINEQKIQRQKCGKFILINDVLTQQVKEKIKKYFETTQQIQEQELTYRLFDPCLF